MTSKEAAQCIDFLARNPNLSLQDCEALTLAIEALERDTPMANQFFAPDFLCPKCGLGVAHLTVNVKYCPECGQKIIEQGQKKRRRENERNGSIKSLAANCE